MYKKYRILKNFSSIELGNLTAGQVVNIKTDLAEQMAMFNLVIEHNPEPPKQQAPEPEPEIEIEPEKIKPPFPTEPTAQKSKPKKAKK